MDIKILDVKYLRYEDDILILCKTERQMNRCRRRMMDVLHERHLSLSRKKSRMGCINEGFHFLGIDYLSTRLKDNTNVTHASDNPITSSKAVLYLDGYGGVTISEHQKHEPTCIVPHPRTLRKASENIKSMVATGLSTQKIRHYLHRWVAWWAMTSNTWQYQEILRWFIDVCWHKTTAHYAIGLHQLYFKKLHTETVSALVA